MNIFRTKREELGITQTELAKRTQLSVRTIQRVENGSTPPKGFTLTSLCLALGLNDEEHSQKANTPEDIKKVKLINLSCLAFLGLPFGNIILPIWLWRKSNLSLDAEATIRDLINWQITWTLVLCLSLILIPFFFPKGMQIHLWLCFFLFLFNIVVVVRSAYLLQKGEVVILPPRIPFF